MDALDARDTARILYGTGNNSNIESPSKVPKEALYPGLTPLVEPANRHSQIINTIERYHRKLVENRTKPEDGRKVMSSLDSYPVRKEMQVECEEPEHFVAASKNARNTENMEDSKPNANDVRGGPPTDLKLTTEILTNKKEERRGEVGKDLIDFSESIDVKDPINNLDKHKPRGDKGIELPLHPQKVQCFWKNYLGGATKVDQVFRNDDSGQQEAPHLDAKSMSHVVGSMLPSLLDRRLDFCTNCTIVMYMFCTPSILKLQIILSVIAVYEMGCFLSVVLNGVMHYHSYIYNF